MSIQYSTTHRNNDLADITTQAGATAYLLIYSGSAPANCAASATGTLLASLPMSNPIAPAPSAGLLTMSAITTENAVATGVAGYWRICTDATGATCVAQGTIFQTVVIGTNGSTAVNGNVLSFASTSGVQTGMTVSGAGVPANATVVAVSSTTVTLSPTSTLGVGSFVAITFGGDISMNTSSIVALQAVAISSFAITATGA